MNKQQVIKELADLGIVKVVIEYCGYGDSGSVETVHAYREGDVEPLDEGEIDKLVYRADPSGVAVRVSNALLGIGNEELSTRLSTFAYDALDQAGVPDWVNNEGGKGTMAIYAKPSEDEDGQPVEAGNIIIRHHDGTYEDAGEEDEDDYRESKHRYSEDATVYML